MKLLNRFAASALLSMLGLAAHAQSSVTVYGRMDLGYRYDSTPGGNRHDIANNSNNALGFKGVEDLGGGLQAFFQMEHRFQGDTGTAANPFWAEIAIVGLRGGFGEVRLGSQSGPFGVAPDQDAFGGDTVGGVGQRKAGADDKYNSSVIYWTPDFGGFTAAVGVADSLPTERRGTSAVLRYAAGPLLAMVSYAKRGNRDNAWAVGGTYDATWAKFFLAIAQNDGDASGVERKTFDLGIAVPLGPGSIRAKVNNDDINGVKTRNIGAGYWYDLSKRTMLYTDVGFEKTDDSKRVRRFDAGIRHNF
jgi:predicted porin